MSQTFTLGDYYITAHSSEEYHQLKSEIFTQDNYYFETEILHPVIIDAGAHIGMSTLYFKKLYPFAEIIAIEPLVQNIALLRENILQNGLSDTTVIEKALSDEPGNIQLYFDNTDAEWFSTAGAYDGAWNKQQISTHTSVETLTLSSLLSTKETIDFLKMDIEGMESVVLFEAKQYLSRIKHFIIEYHPTPDQDLGVLTELLREHFDLTFWQDGKSIKRPKHPSRLLLIEGVNKNIRTANK